MKDIFANEWRGPSSRLSAWATQLQRNVATVASRWRHCPNLTGLGIEPHTSRTDSVHLASELIGFNDHNLMLGGYPVMTLLDTQ